MAALTTILLALASLLGDAAATPGTVAMRFARSEPKNKIVKRDPTTVLVGNQQNLGLYYVNATVGTPGMEIQFQIDTGSSDVWMFNAEACQETQCLGGYYQASNSSTYKLLQKNKFEIQYVTPGSEVVGDYITDAFSLGSLKLNNLEMAVATKAKEVQTGIMGIGFDNDESVVSQGGSVYPSIIDTMVNQGIIGSHSYSLWLDDQNAEAGTILFGGYDSNKYTGQLTVLPIQPDAQSGTISSFTVAWTLFALTDSSGTTAISGSYPYAAVLDSGTTLMAIPSDLYQPIAGYFGVENTEDYGPIFPCKYATGSGTLDFGFGGNNGAVIQVPFSEVAIETAGDDGQPLRYNNGDQACIFGIEETPQEGVYLLGDTFLRSAYVVYDIDAKQIGLAQTNWNSNTNNVKAIGNGTLDSIIPSASLAAGATVTQSATASGFEPIGSHTHTGSAGFGASSSASGTISYISGQKTTLNVATLTQSPTNQGAVAAGTGSASGSATAATSSHAAAAAVAPSDGRGLLFTMATVFVMMVGGAAMFAQF